MKYIFAALSGLVMLQACREQKTQHAEQPAAVSDPVGDSTHPGMYAGCYLMTIDSDSATLKLEYDGKEYSGNLEYRRSAKDANVGKVRLVDAGQYLKGFYDFQSEGLLSVRELILKKSGTSLAEGYGELDMHRDSAKFKFPANLDYEEKHPFVKQNCP